MTLCQVINSFYGREESNHPSFILTYLPVISFAFLIITFIIDRAIANRSKNKQIIREWYNKALLDPCLVNCNSFFIEVMSLTGKYLAEFDFKSSNLSLSEFLIYKARINDKFEKLKVNFYNENLLPIYQNYPKIAESMNNVLLEMQDEFIKLFGGKSIDKVMYQNFINVLYTGKGKMLAILEAPLTSKGKSRL